MTRPRTDTPQWAVVDEGWGRYLARKPEGAERA
jgi:hypothetical protein